MKKILLLAVAAVIALFANAYDFKVDGLCYNYNEDGTSVSVTRETAFSGEIPGYYNLYGNMNIPTNVIYNNTTYTVTSIGYRAFDRCEGLTSVTIPNSVTSIGQYAFNNCSGISSVTIGNSVTSIDYGAFCGCSGLISVTIPNSVTSIRSHAFSGCTGLNSITVDIGNTQYDSRDNCNAIIETETNNLIAGCKGTIIPNSVTSIGQYAFEGCSGLTSVNIPNSVTSIGERAFYCCTGLTSVNIGNSVTLIDIQAFSDCTGLTSVNIPNSVTHLGGFSGCTGLTSLNIPNSVTYLGDFIGCTGLTSVAIPNSVTEIGEGAFLGCTGLKSLRLNLDPHILSYEGVFSGCNVEELTLDNGSVYEELIEWIKEDDIFNQSLTKLVLGNTVDYLPHNAFDNLTNLTSVTIGNMLEYIPNGAFGDCSNLTSLIIGNSVKGIYPYAFQGCSNLTSVTIPNTVTYFGWDAFNGCTGIQELTITGKGVSNIGNVYPLTLGILSLRVGSEITSLGEMQIAPWEVYCYAKNPPTCLPNTFTSYNGNLHVPSSAAASYFTADYWQNFNGFNYDITEQVTLNQSEASLFQWDNLELIATVTPNDSELQWFSTNSNVAVVDENGVVTAVAAGECEIYATLASNIAVYESCHVTVDYPEITLSLNEDNMEMTVGEEKTLIANISPENTGLIPNWESSDNSVAIVNLYEGKFGLVKAVGEGECDITATILDKTVTCHVSVSGDVTINLSVDNAILGASQMLTVYPSCTPDVPVELVVTSSDPSVALARVVNRTNAPASGLTSIHEKDMALNLIEELGAPSECKDPALASTKAIMIVGLQNGTATITVTTADGKAEPAVLNLRVVDVDGDRTITASDITQLYNYILTGDETYINTSDVNGDGAITSADVTAIYSLILGN